MLACLCLQVCGQDAKHCCFNRLPGEVGPLVDGDKVLCAEDVVNAFQREEACRQRIGGSIGSGGYVSRLCETHARQDVLARVGVGCGMSYGKR